jgi:4-diphosphocytidyl-2-C-methyl-D-erythritol kinase
VFQLIDHGDTLHFDLRDDGASSRNDVPGVPEEQDLIVRALRRCSRNSRRHGRAAARHRCRHRKAPADGRRAGRRLVGCGHRADGANHLWQAGLNATPN